MGVMAGVGLTARDLKSANQRTMRGLLVATRSAGKRQTTPNESADQSGREGDHCREVGLRASPMASVVCRAESHTHSVIPLRMGQRERLTSLQTLPGRQILIPVLIRTLLLTLILELARPALSNGTGRSRN